MTEIKVPKCKCLLDCAERPTMHKPGCKRIAAIKKKYGFVDRDSASTSEKDAGKSKKK